MSKVMKLGLKEARELIKQKEFKEAIKRCKTILKEDKQNYVALVLLGAAMQEVEELRSQAPLALKKAAELQPNNTLAWQGLVAFYEREPSNHSALLELITAHSKLLQVDSDSAKFSPTINKIVDLVLQIQDDTALAQVISTFNQLKEREMLSEDRVRIISSSLAKILTQYPKDLKEYSTLLEDTLAKVCKDVNVTNRQEYYRKYLKILYNIGKLDALLTEAASMHKEFSDDTYPLEWICRVYSEKSILNGSCNGIEITPFYETLQVLNADSSMAAMAKAVNLYQSANFIEARDTLNHVVFLKPNWLHPWVALAEVNLKLYCFEEAERAAARANQLIKPDTPCKIELKIQLAMFEAISRTANSKDSTISMEMIEDRISRDSSSHKFKLILARVRVQLEDPKANDLLKELENYSETKVEATVLKAIALKNQKKLDEAADVLGSALENSEAWLVLGKIHWEMGDYNHSQMAFLKGIHADPYNWECLVYLGHYYQRYGKDLERCRKCYQKALQINPASEEAGIGLSTAFRLLKNSEANMQLLQRVTMYGGGPKWAWLQLGLHYLDQGEPEQAINSLRNVIRSNPNDNHCWEILADAYLERGAHASALKSYHRALELIPGSLYPMIQIANIKLILSQFIEAKKDFEQVLLSEQSYIPALKGLAETLLGLSKEYACKQLLGRSRENAELAADYLTTAITENSGISCIWKLLGDACYQIATLPKKYCFMKITAGLVKSQTQEQHVTIERADIFSLSIKSYCRALSLSPVSALLWHDLASCYLSQLKMNSVSDRHDVANKAVAAAKQAIKIAPSSWMHWNLLGVICMTHEIKNYALSQHCYVMAIDMELQNPVAWSNLGTLYLHLGDPYRANEAFSRAQRVDPGYNNSWIGQALIAEKMTRKEAMDLFRHTTQLGYHNQAALGYTHWVLTTLLNSEAKKDPLYIYTIENMHAVSVAMDGINWYLEHVPDDPYALNAHGLLLERQKLYNPAVRAFTLALKLATKDNEKDSLRVNLSRSLVQLNKFDEAVQLCQGIKNADFNSHCQLALSLFKAERYEESYGAYEAALHWLAGDGSDKAHVLCAMAAMAYMFQGVDDAKTLLFQCIRIQPPTVSGLLAAAALGLLHQDINLTALVLKELKPYQDHPEHRNHITLLSAYAHVVQDDRKTAIRVLSKAAHRHPGDVESWVSLVRLLPESEPKIIGNSAEKALYLGRKNCTDTVAKVSCTSSISHLVSGLGDKGLKSSEKTIYSFPYMAESWATLVAALLPRSNFKDSSPSAHWMTVLISIIRRRFAMTRPMAQWLSNNERKASLMADRIVISG
ncbi:superkiller complex protein 3 isoform X1 [Neodiprion pinetum]|uniref:superkiller complex protein 3 isoform X1 n=2 Tax=Neodiprion pinetum TaxID=441929 RepID=UPI001EDF4872|nr:tetratricopeptide repeat protein 37 isoform X1 [Neodiprion pinetum]XP_046485172.1 tetratricopeptide repeat protein 37 isoform X1 [Neodiprion pinetum]